MDGPRAAVQRVAACGVITDGLDRILLTRLSQLTREPGWWTLPGGGLDHGEHPRDAVVREVYEEAGLPATVHELLDVDSTHTVAPDDDYHVVRVIYCVEVPADKEPRVMEVGGSTDAVRWVGFGEVPSLPLLDSARLGVAHALRRHRTVHHLALPDDWAAARVSGKYVVSARGRSLDGEGCVWRYQLPAVAEALFADVDGLLVLSVDLDRVPSPVRVESGSGTEHFPHLYGPIPVDAVTAVRTYA